jgi:hypothetical protein
LQTLPDQTGDAPPTGRARPEEAIIPNAANLDAKDEAVDHDSTASHPVAECRPMSTVYEKE